MSVKVGICNLYGKQIHVEGFKNIVVLTKSSQYGMLGPYVLKDDNGNIVENI